MRQSVLLVRQGIQVVEEKRHGTRRRTRRRGDGYRRRRARFGLLLHGVARLDGKRRKGAQATVVEHLEIAAAQPAHGMTRRIAHHRGDLHLASLGVKSQHRPKCVRAELDLIRTEARGLGERSENGKRETDCRPCRRAALKHSVSIPKRARLRVRAVKWLRMTTMDISYRFSGDLDESQLRALAGLPDVYGIRALRLDEASGAIAIEYDATRLDAARVTALVRGCGIAAEALSA